MLSTNFGLSIGFRAQCEFWRLQSSRKYLKVVVTNFALPLICQKSLSSEKGSKYTQKEKNDIHIFIFINIEFYVIKLFSLESL